MHNFIEDVKYNYKLLRPIKVQTSAAGNPTNYIREKLLNIVEETIIETEKKDTKLFSDTKNKTGKTAVEEGEENDEELVGSEYSDEDDYIENGENDEDNFENKESEKINNNKNRINNNIEKDKQILYKNKLKYSKIKTNLIPKFESEEKEKNKKILNDKILYRNLDIYGGENAQSK